MASDPYALYTDTGDRQLVFSNSDYTRVWLTNRIALLGYLLHRVRLWR